jgi:polysaccharide export outer membrane protein
VAEAATSSPAAASTVVRVRLDDLQSGAAENNVVLRPNDTVLVPRASRVFVTGQVRRPGLYALTPGMTVRQAIGQAGGFSGRGRPRLRVVRQDGERTAEIKAGVDDALAPGDTLVVEKGY